MASGDVYISFGADTGPLEASFATARAEVKGLQAELNKTANEMRATGAAADTQLGQRLNALASQLSVAKGHFSELNDELKAHKAASSGAAQEIANLLAGFRQMTEGITGVHEAFSSAAETFAAAFAVHEMANWIGSTQDAGERIDRLSHQLGASTTEVQQLGAIASLTGTDFEGMVRGIERMDLRLRESASATNPARAALKALQIDVKTFIDLPAPQKLEELAGAVSRFADGAGKTSAVEALNRNLVDIIPALDRGKEGFAELEKTARAAGVIMSDQDVKALADAKEQSVALGLALKGLSQNIELLVDGPLAHAIERLAAFVGLLNDAAKLARSFGGIGNFIGMMEANQSMALGGGGDIFVHPEGLHDRNLGVGFGAKPAVQFNPGAEPRAGRGRADHTDAEQARQAYQTEAEAAQLAAQKEIDALNNAVRQHKISWDEWARQSIAALEKEKAAIQAAANEALQSAHLTSIEKQRIMNEEARALSELAKKEADDAAKAAEETQRAWDGFFRPFNTSIERMVDGAVTGHETMARTFAKAIDSMLVDALRFFTQWALHQAEMVAAHVAGNQVMQASDATANLFNLGQLLASATRAISVDAGVTAAGVAANQAPLTGPLAIGEAAAAASSVLGFAAYDIGAWSLPEDQLAMVHKSELIMPAPEASAFRDMLSGAARAGGGFGEGAVHIHPTTNFNMNNLDGQSANAWVRANGSIMAKSIHDAVRQGAALGLKRLR